MSTETRFSSSFEQKWSHTMTTEGGTRLTVSGSDQQPAIVLEIHEPATGYGMNETPSATARIGLMPEAFDEIVSRINRAIARAK